jgi:hypothetical protein
MWTKEQFNENLSAWGKSFSTWLYSLSERTLTITSIVILHSVFIPSIYAYMNALTDQLPSLDTYILVVSALVIMNLRAIIKKDSVATLIHMVGFVVQLVILAIVLMK